ncbi:MAG: alpha,alpha-trehalase TreF [Bacteroidota bacterium]
MKLTNLIFLLLVGLVIGCQNAQETSTDQSTEGTAKVDFYTTDLFKAVQLEAVFPDSKTFVDCNPKKPLSEIVSIYEQQKNKEDFELSDFVEEYFTPPITPGTGFTSDTSRAMEDHIAQLWPVLTRKPDQYNPNSSLIPIPNSYIVPGGRFSEIYYWDSYFTMLGLEVSGQHKMAINMVDNFSFIIDSIGFIPNGNRNYFLGRSQPPFYSLMVKLISQKADVDVSKYLTSLEKEYAFWMEGADQLTSDNNTHRRVVMLPDGEILNRYWDNYAEPRPESYKEDVHLLKETGREEEKLYRDLRAACESGWDFSSRWFEDDQNLGTIHTTDILPVDLNSLLFHLELTLSVAYEQSGDAERYQLYLDKANTRKEAISKYFWDEERSFFTDYDFIKGASTGRLSMAGTYPLFFQLSSVSQAKAVAEKLEADFLKTGGFVTTLSATGEQWDAPNGWAPLQWMAIKGLQNYNYDELAEEAASRWLALNERVYKATGKMVEKYNVTTNDLEAGGGEYPLQDGFGWSNGVALKLITEGYEIEVF